MHTTNDPMARIWAAACYLLPVAIFTLACHMLGSIRAASAVLFHAWQCVLIWGVAMVLILVLEIFNLYLLLNAFCLGVFACLLFLAFKAFMGRAFRLPSLGAFAAARAGL